MALGEQLGEGTDRYTAYASKEELLRELLQFVDGQVPLQWDIIQRLNNTDTSTFADPTATVQETAE